MQVEEKILIDAPAEKIFAAYADVANWPDWDSDVVSSQLDGPFEVGSIGKLKPKQGPETKIKLVEVTSNESFTVECKMPLCRMHFVHELTPENQHVQVTNKVIFSGLLAPVFGRLIGKEISSTLPGSLQGLKAHVEAQ